MEDLFTNWLGFNALMWLGGLVVVIVGVVIVAVTDNDEGGAA